MRTEDGKMRNLMPFALLIAFALAGCQATPPHAIAVADRPHETGYSSTLLFSRDATLLPAAQYAARSIWPGITSPTAQGEQILVRERFIDYQGPGARGRDFTYRRFDAYRVGYQRP